MSLILVVIGAFMTFILVACVFGLIISFPVMLLWNLCLVPAIPALQTVGWLQMWGIVVLCSFLFKSTAKSN